jgi:hypothetical protein
MNEKITITLKDKKAEIKMESVDLVQALSMVGQSMGAIGKELGMTMEDIFKLYLSWSDELK